ncbi:hypothetical protein DSECCO2_120350 [anaerobic digester metagenome]
MKKEINWSLLIRVANDNIVKVLDVSIGFSNATISMYANLPDWHYCTSLDEVNAILNTSLNSEQVLKLINDTIDNGSCSLADVECIAEIAPLQPKFIKVVKYDDIAIDAIMTYIYQEINDTQSTEALVPFVMALAIINQVFHDTISQVVYNNNHKIAWYSGDTLHELIWDDNEIKLIK